MHSAIQNANPPIIFYQLKGFFWTAPRPYVGLPTGRLLRAEKHARRLRRITASIPGADLVLSFELIFIEATGTQAPVWGR